MKVGINGFGRIGRLVLRAARGTDIEVVGVAGNGDDAPAIASEHTPDVVLLDVRMPVMDGVEGVKSSTRVTLISVLSCSPPTMTTNMVATR